jgi:hypothetical protein
MLLKVLELTEALVNFEVGDGFLVTLVHAGVDCSLGYPSADSAVSTGTVQDLGDHLKRFQSRNTVKIDR